MAESNLIAFIRQIRDWAQANAAECDRCARERLLAAEADRATGQIYGRLAENARKLLDVVHAQAFEESNRETKDNGTDTG